MVISSGLPPQVLGASVFSTVLKFFQIHTPLSPPPLLPPATSPALPQGKPSTFPAQIFEAALMRE